MKMWCAVVLVGMAACGSKEGTAKKGPDLGALGVKNAHVVGDGILAGGQPTKEQLARAKEMGVRTVINLRSEAEEAEYAGEEELVTGSDVRYLRIPIEEDGTGLTEAAARKLADAMEAGPTIVHCSGGNRAAALVALEAYFVDKKSQSEALEIGKQAGLARQDLYDVVARTMAASPH